jgi:chloramphenicol-sensitive protein RarD
MGSIRRGYLYGIAAYGLWGFFPLYIKLLHPAGSVEILAHRIVWSVVFLTLVLLLVTRRRFRVPRGRRLLGVAASAALISVNWGAFIYGINTDRVVEASLGYFINPLVTVLLGVLVLGEPMPPARLVGFGLVWIALIIFTTDMIRDVRRHEVLVRG